MHIWTGPSGLQASSSSQEFLIKGFTNLTSRRMESPWDAFASSVTPRTSDLWKSNRGKGMKERRRKPLLSQFSQSNEVDVIPSSWLLGEVKSLMSHTLCVCVYMYNHIYTYIWCAPNIRICKVPNHAIDSTKYIIKWVLLLLIKWSEYLMLNYLCNNQFNSLCLTVQFFKRHNVQFAYLASYLQ